MTLTLEVGEFQLTSKRLRRSTYLALLTANSERNQMSPPGEIFDNVVVSTPVPLS
jgi:hypothetical protein